MNHRMRMAIAAVVLAGAFGCDGPNLKGEGLVRSGAHRPAWPFVPVAMRVHPFTSIAWDEAAKTMSLEARIELLDQVGDVTKGVGTFQFELFETEGRASISDHARRPAATWRATMVSLEENRRHYDPITRTYVFKLKVDATLAPGQRLLLVVHFTDHTGRHLNAQAPLRTSTLTPKTSE